MTDIRFDSAKLNTDGDGQLWLLLRVVRDDRPNAFKFVKIMQERVYTACLKLFREKRSNDANAYMWVLLERLAKAVGEQKETLYLGYIKQSGVYKDFTLDQDVAETFCIAWSRLGTGWPTEQVDFDQDGERVIIRAYYGSSTYNTKQMSRLIDSVVEDCRAVGVETLPPDKLTLLKEEWRGQHPSKSA